MGKVLGIVYRAIARLVALVPKPRVNLTRVHSVFAPHSKYRARVTTARRGKGRKTRPLEKTQDQNLAEHRAAMTWPFSHTRVLHGTGTS